MARRELEALLEMGFGPRRAQRALELTGHRGIEPAMDCWWLTRTTPTWRTWRKTCPPRGEVTPAVSRRVTPRGVTPRGGPGRRHRTRRPRGCWRWRGRSGRGGGGGRSWGGCGSSCGRRRRGERPPSAAGNVPRSGWPGSGCGRRSSGTRRSEPRSSGRPRPPPSRPPPAPGPPRSGSTSRAASRCGCRTGGR